MPKRPTANFELNEGDTLSIILSSAGAHSPGSIALAHTASAGTVLKVTEKAVQVEAETRKGKKVNAWFPRAALQRLGEGYEIPLSSHRGHVTQLAKWFKPQDWTAKFLDMTSESHIISA